ncbi:hypothetical protein RB653_001255 [Dictyostelium firmibasis]|uniref:Transmembrane protein n=1 Tax=Dictyostelium firmibasis TaxID=79012 RepID=A0AAN7Z1X9_9MYCE
MVKISALISLVFVVLSFIAATIAFSSYWYYMKIETTNNGMTTTTTTYLKYNQAKLMLEMGGNKQTVIGDYTSDMKSSMKHQLEIFNASLAFDILGWITLVIASVLISLQAVGKLSLIPIPMISLISKCILIVSTVFLMISMFVFCGLSNARSNDCKDQMSASSSTTGFDSCDSDYYKSFTGEVNAGGQYMKWGPHLSFGAVVVASGLSLIACIITFVCGVFVNEETIGK